jgi:thioredoxin 1
MGYNLKKQIYIKMKQILYFTSSWCQPCRILSPTMESLKDQINYNKLDVDANPDLAIKYKIKSVPTLILIKDNNELNRISGVRPAHEILNFYNS